MRVTDDITAAYVILRTQSLPPNVTGRARRGLHGADPDSDRGDPAHSRGTRCDRDRADGHWKNGCFRSADSNEAGGVDAQRSAAWDARAGGRADSWAGRADR